jgi:hypothetical protein
MSELVGVLIGILARTIEIYTLILLVRVLLSWFPNLDWGNPVHRSLSECLSRSDPTAGRPRPLGDPGVPGPAADPDPPGAEPRLLLSGLLLKLGHGLLQRQEIVEFTGAGAHWGGKAPRLHIREGERSRRTGRDGQSQGKTRITWRNISDRANA